MRTTSCVLATAMLLILLGPRVATAQAASRDAGQIAAPASGPVAMKHESADFLARLDALTARVRAHDASLDELSATVLALEPRAGSVAASDAEVRAYRALQDSLIERLRARWQAAEAHLTDDRTELQSLAQAHQALHVLITAMKLQARPDEVALVELEVEMALKNRGLREACTTASSGPESAAASICVGR